MRAFHSLACCFAATLVVLATPLARADTIAASGLYVASDPLTHKRRTLPDSVYDNPVASGVYIRLVWAQVEPAPGRFDFSALDAELERAVAAGRKISISVITGGRSPAWLERDGIETREFRIGRGGGSGRECVGITMAVPWNPAYLAAYGRLVKAIAARVRAKPGAWEALRIVKLTPITRLTEEMRLPADMGDEDVCDGAEATNIWLEAGYTVDRVVDAWTTGAEHVAEAFPEKLLALDTLDRNDFPRVDEKGSRVPQSPVKEKVITQGLARFPGRFAVQWNGLTANGRISASALKAHADGAVLGWQTNAFMGFDGAGCNDRRKAAPQVCTTDAYAAILERGIDSGATYIEIWPDDVANFPDVVAAADRRLTAEGRK